MVISVLPLEKDPKFHSVAVEFTPKGLDLWISFSILYSALIILLEAKIDKLAIFDSSTEELLVNAYLTEPVVFVPFHDLKISQLIKLEFESVGPLKRLVKCLSIGGEKEFLRTTLRLDFNLTLTICGFMTIESMQCSKIADLGKSEQDKVKFRNRKLGEKLFFRRGILFVQKLFLACIPYDLQPAEYQILVDNPYVEPVGDKESKVGIVPSIPTILIVPHYLIQDLLPNPEVALKISPGLTTKSQTTLMFSSPPAINISLGTVELDLYLNQALICHIICDPFMISSKSSTAIYTVTVIPRVVTNPITGSISGGMSILKGIFAGVGNGLLFQEWGAQSTIIGVRNINFKDHNGRVGWVDDILDGFEIEQSLDVARGCEIVGERKDEISELVGNIWQAILGKLKQ